MELMENIIDLIITIVPIILIFIGLFAGTIAEKRHFKRLDVQEAEYAHIPVTDVRTYLYPVDTQVQPVMVLSTVVVATDYFKTFLAQIRKIFGGELRSYRSLMERARREGVVRLKQQAIQHQCNAICNVRIDTADIGGATRKKGAAMVGVIVTGTAYRVHEFSNS